MKSLLACCLLAGCLTAGDADPLALLPELPKPALQVATAPPFDPQAGTAFGPGVRFVAGQRVVLDGVIQIDKGPSDGLEVLACLREGKTHEALVRLNSNAGELMKAAGIAAFGLGDGRPAEEGRGIPARGTPLAITALWRDEDGKWRWIDAAQLIRDRSTDRPFPALPWVWTGSRILLIAESQPDGTVVRRERFMLDNTRSLAVNFDEPDALLASPFPCAVDDQRFEANSAITPPPGTAVHLALAPAPAVLTLRLTAEGALQQDGRALDAEALVAALAGPFAVAATPPHRAVLVRTAVGTGDEQVVEARRRILAAAAAAKAWTVPLFQAE